MEAVVNIALFGAVAVGVLEIIDWILPERQKQKISDASLLTWNWLDDNRALDYLRKFKNYKDQVKISAAIQGMITAGIAAVATYAYFYGNESERQLFWFGVGVVAAAPLVIWVAHPKILAWITNGKNSVEYFMRSTVSVLPVLLIMFLFESQIKHFFPEHAQLTEAPAAPLQSALVGAFVSFSSVILYFWYINIALALFWLLSLVTFSPPPSPCAIIARGRRAAWEAAVRHFTVLLVLTGALAAGAPSLANDLTLPKTAADALKAACAKAGGKYSEGDNIYGCGTDCAGKPGTDCTVTCMAGKRCTAQVIGGRRPRSVADALTKPGRH